MRGAMDTAYARHRGYAFRVVKHIVWSIRPCPENPGVWGNAPANRKPDTDRMPVEQSGKSTTIQIANYDESVVKQL